MERYDIKEGYVINKGIWKTEANRKYKIHFIPAPLFSFSLPLSQPQPQN